MRARRSRPYCGLLALCVRFVLAAAACQVERTQVTLKICSCCDAEFSRSTATVTLDRSELASFQETISDRTGLCPACAASQCSLKVAVQDYTILYPAPSLTVVVSGAQPWLPNLASDRQEASFGPWFAGDAVEMLLYPDGQDCCEVRAPLKITKEMATGRDEGRTVEVTVTDSEVLVGGTATGGTGELRFPRCEDPAVIAARPPAKVVPEADPADHVAPDMDDGYQSLWSVTIDGVKRHIVTLAHGGYMYASLSPDGRRVAWERTTGVPEEATDIYSAVMYDLKSERFVRLTPQSAERAWLLNWFADSRALLVQGRRIVNTDTLATISLRGAENNLGGRPSPDCTKIAVWAGQTDEGTPLTLYIYDRQGNRTATIDTQLYTQISDDGFGPMQVNFEWLDDSRTLVVEHWQQPWESCAVSLLDTQSGAVSLLVDNASGPAVSTDGRIAVLRAKSWGPRATKLEIYDRAGKLLTTCAPALPDIAIWKHAWARDGNHLLIEGGRAGLILWDVAVNDVVYRVDWPRWAELVGATPGPSGILVFER